MADQGHRHHLDLYLGVDAPSIVGILLHSTPVVDNKSKNIKLEKIKQKNCMFQKEQ